MKPLLILLACYLTLFSADFDLINSKHCDQVITSKTSNLQKCYKNDNLVLMLNSFDKVELDEMNEVILDQQLTKYIKRSVIPFFKEHEYNGHKLSLEDNLKDSVFITTGFIYPEDSKTPDAFWKRYSYQDDETCYFYLNESLTTNERYTTLVNDEKFDFAALDNNVIDCSLIYEIYYSNKQVKDF